MRIAALAGRGVGTWPRRPKKIERVALVAADSFNLVHFRGPLISCLVADGVRVFVLAPAFSDEAAVKIRDYGGEPVLTNLSSTAASPIMALLESLRLAKQLRQLRVDAVLAFYIKASVVATLASVIARVKTRFISIEGLGYFLGSGRKTSFRDGMLAAPIRLALRACVGMSTGAFFMNADDRRTLLNGKFSKKVIHLRGVGVDLEHYRETSSSESPPSFVYVGRLLFEKGIADFVAAAKAVRVAHPAVSFVVVGAGDGTARSVSDAVIEQCQSEGTIIWLGQVADVRPAIARSTALILPSLGEGAPRCIQEAMAMGRPVITTHAPGCREMIEHDVHGMLVPTCDPDALAGAIVRLIEKPELASRLGKAARQRAEAEFDAAKTAKSMKAHIIGMAGRV